MALYILQPKSFCLLFRRKLLPNIFIFFFYFCYSFSLFLSFVCTFSSKTCFYFAYHSNVIHMQILARILVCHTSHKWFRSVNFSTKSFFFSSSSLTFRMEVVTPVGKSTEWSITKHDFFSSLFGKLRCCMMVNVKCQKETRK